MIFYNILKDKYLRIIFGLSLLLVVFSFIAVFLNLLGASYPLVIHFDSFSGVDFFGGKFEVFSILISGLAIILLNFFLADFIYFRERFVSYLLVFGSLGISVLILLALGVIISVN